MVENHLSEIISVIQFLITCLFAVFSFFARRTLYQIENDIKNNSVKIDSLMSLQNEIQLTKKELEHIARDVSNIRNISEDIAVLKRDQKTMWLRIDELKEKTDDLNKFLLDNGRRTQ